MTTWNEAPAAREARLQAGSRIAKGKVVQAAGATALLEAVIRPGDRVCLEGDNQKQADLLARALAAVDVARIHNLHMASPRIRRGSRRPRGCSAGVSTRFAWRRDRLPASAS